MKNIIVVNKRSHSGPGQYIGRPSVLGNPYTHLTKPNLAETLVGSREEALSCYREWITKKLESDTPERREFERLVEKYQREGSLVLLCWCKPQACHGDILAELIIEKAGVREKVV